MSQAELSTPNVDAFIEATCLLPGIVLDGIADEVCSFLHAHGADDTTLSSVFTALRSDEVTAAVEQKTLYAYNRSPAFKRKMRSQDPRPAYYSFMRHWVATELKDRFPEQYRLLPASFGQGLPLPS